MTLPIAIRCTALLAALLLASCGDYDKVTKDETGQQVGSPSGGAPSTPGAAGAGAGGMQPGPDSTPEPAATPEPAVTPEPAATPEPAVTPEPTTTEPGPPAVEASCDMDATACGGDVAGTWTVKDCPLTLSGEVDMAGFGLGCTTATVTSGTLSVSGTWTADGEGGFTDDTTTTGMEVMEMPPECLTVSGTVTTCDRVGGPVQSSLGYSMFECVDNPDTGGCTCTGTIDQEGGMGQVSIFATQEGLYTSEDDTLGLGDNGDFAYCAADGALVLTYATPPKIGTVMGSIVLQQPGAAPSPGPAAAAVSCDMDATPCGGDVAGTWTVNDCPLTLSGEVDMAGFGLGCTTATVTSGTLSVSGTWTADGDGGFTDDTTTTGMEVMEMPPECLTVSGTVTTCDRVGGPVQSSLGYSMFECVDNADTGGCTCTGTIDQQGGMGQVSIFATEEGLYTSMDNTLGLGDNGDFAYCAADGAMVLTYATPPKIGTVTGSIVLNQPGAAPAPAPAGAEATCDMDATACGGDVAGTWTVKDCPLTLSGEVDMAGFGLGCTTATVTSGTLSVSGTWTADGEGGFTDDTTTTGMEVMEMPPECLTVSGTVTTCDRVGGPVQSSLGYSMFECVDNADTGGCTCTGTIDQQGGMGQVSIFATQEGLYTAMDNTLGLGDNGDFGYCAADGAMVLTYAAAPKIGTVTGSIVLQKQ